MGRRQTMMEKYKLQMKAYKKRKMKTDNTPFLPESNIVYLMNTINPENKIRAEGVKTSTKNQRQIITSVQCPVCHEDMVWDPKLEAFTCSKHPKRLVYEVVD